MRNSIDLWTPYGGWIRHRQDTPYGYNVTRRVLDPLLRAHDGGDAGGGPAGGLDGERADRERPAVRGRRGGPARTRAVRCPAGSWSRPTAGTRGSRGWPAFPAACARTTASSTGPTSAASRPTGGRSRMWFMEPDCAYAFPNEDGLCLVLVGPHRNRLPEFRADLEGAYARFVAALPGRARPVRRDARVEASSASSTCRTSAARRRGGGIAFVGDAALASDPLWGDRLRLGLPERRVAGGRDGGRGPRGR